MIDGWTCLAKIIKPDTKNKGLVLDISAGSFFNHDVIQALVGIEMCIAPPEHDLSRFVTFDSFKKLPKNKSFAKLKGEHNYDNYFPLCGKYVLCNVDDFKKILDGETLEKFNAASLVGKDVVDSKFGKIGKVVDIADNLAHLILVVKDNNKEVMIPMVDEFVKETMEQKINVDIPQSLLELNRDIYED